MKCLEGYTTEQVRKMSYEEILVLAEKVGKEIQEIELKNKIVNMIDVMNAQDTGSLIEN